MSYEDEAGRRRKIGIPREVLFELKEQDLGRPLRFFEKIVFSLAIMEEELYGE